MSSKKNSDDTEPMTTYTDFTNWEKVERPRVASLSSFGSNYLSLLAINGDDYLRYQAKLNPIQPFQGVSDTKRSVGDVE